MPATSKTNTYPLRMPEESHLCRTGARRPGENGACHHDGKISLEAEAGVTTHAMTVAVAACPG